MAKAKSINDVITRAKCDMAVNHQLSRGVYFDICEYAANGIEFCVEMSTRDALKMRAWINRHGMKNVMHQTAQADGNVRVCFNV